MTSRILDSMHSTRQRWRNIAQAIATPGAQVATQSTLQAPPLRPQTALTGSPVASSDGKVYRISAGDLEQLRPLPDRKPPLSTSTLDHTVIGIALPRFVQ